jgi:hypothetical protein
MTSGLGQAWTVLPKIGYEKYDQVLFQKFYLI